MLKLKPGLRLGAADTVRYGTVHGPGDKRKLMARGEAWQPGAKRRSQEGKAVARPQ